MDDLVTVLGVLFDLQLTDLHNGLVLASINSHAKAEVDRCSRIGILRSDIDVVFLAEGRLRHIDWVLVAFLLLVDACLGDVACSFILLGCYSCLDLLSFLLGSLGFVGLLEDNLLDLLQVYFQGLLGYAIWRLLGLLGLFLFFAFDSNRLVLALILSPLILDSILVKLEKLFDRGALAHRRRQVTKRVTQEDAVATVMENVLSHHLRQIIFFVAPLDIHQVVSVHVPLQECLFRQVGLLGCISVGGSALQSRFFDLVGPRHGYFELWRQFMCVDELKDDIFELAQTPANLKRGVIL